MRNQHKTALLAAISVSALTLVSACGDSDDGGAPTPPPAPAPAPAPVMQSVMASGVITGFSSVAVGGETYEVDNETEVEIEGQPPMMGDDSGLKLGMNVDIEATETNGERVAEKISYDEDLRGPARDVMPSATDMSIGTFTVVEQLVTVDANTIFDDDIGDNDANPGIDIRDLDPANFPGNAPIVVEVSGFPTETGFLATRIDRVNAAAGDIGDPNTDDDELEVKGFVDSVAGDGSSFVINGATFLVTGATMFDAGLAADASLVGVFVEVKADIDPSDNLVAVRVEREDDDIDDVEEGDEFEIEGLLQSVDTVSDPNVIVINGVTIPVADASSLVSRVGKRVEIKGAFDANGVLVISQTKLEIENNVRTRDLATGADASALTVTTRLGLTIQATTDSRVEDKSADDGDQLTPAEFVGRVMNGDEIRARGFIDQGSVVWTRIERESGGDPECRLRGPVETGSISDPSFSIQGVTIDTTGLGDAGFKDANDVAIGRSDFFSNLQEGDVVGAKSDSAGAGCALGTLSTMTDGEVSFEPDDGVEGDAGGDDGGGNGGGGNGGGGNGGGDGGDAEVSGAVANLSGDTFMVAGVTVTVTDDTLIDSSIVEAARGVELGDADLRFGDLPETLAELLSNGDLVEVTLDADGNAVKIEDL